MLKSYKVLWEIQPKTIYDKLGDDAIKWQTLMEELRRGQGILIRRKQNKSLGQLL